MHKGLDCAKAGMMAQDRLTPPFVEALIKAIWPFLSTPSQTSKCPRKAYIKKSIVILTIFDCQMSVDKST